MSIADTHNADRIIVLDTETTGMNQIGAHYEGHKIIEIGAVEVINRRLTGNNFHVYLKPDRLVDPEAFGVHGIADEFLLDKPTFADVADEFSKLNRGLPKTDTFCKVTDSLAMARRMFPGKRNSLDALCSRYEIDNSKRTLHGALLDAQILADVYLIMTGGQTALAFNADNDSQQQTGESEIQRLVRQSSALRVILASDEELLAHESRLDLVQKKGGSCLWRG